MQGIADEVGPMNAAYSGPRDEQAAAKDSAANSEDAPVGTTGEAEGDNGADSAFKIGGLATGTNSAPGPSAKIVSMAKKQMPNGGTNGVIIPGDALKGLDQRFDPSMAMEPHLQLM